jgi:hypothetical protein
MGNSRSPSSSSSSEDELSDHVASKRMRRDYGEDVHVANQVEGEVEGEDEGERCKVREKEASDGKRDKDGGDKGGRKESKKEKKKRKAEKKEKKTARHGRKLLSEVADGMMLKVDKRLLKVCHMRLSSFTHIGMSFQFNLARLLHRIQESISSAGSHLPSFSLFPPEFLSLSLFLSLLPPRQSITSS